MDDKTTQDFLTGLQLTQKEAQIYLLLTKKGPLTALQIAQNTAIPRTTIYRLLENLNAKKLTEEIVKQHKSLVEAVSPDKLELLLKQKEAQLSRLHSLFPEVQTYLHQQLNRRQPDTQVKFYKDITGIQQMAWKVLRAKDGIVGYTQSNFAKSVGHKFALSFYEQLYFQKIPMRDLYSDRYIDSMGGVQNLGNEVSQPFSKYFTSRYLPKKTLDIIHTMDIYNHTLAIYNWHQGEIFGVEIQNPKVATMQKQIFEILWNIATPEEELAEKHTKTSLSGAKRSAPLSPSG